MSASAAAAGAGAAPNKMKTRLLGKTGLEVSELCLGGMTLGNFHSMGLPVSGEAEAFKILDAFAAAGGNFIDTANGIYGDSEVVIGKWLATKRREDFVIATKVGFGQGPNQGGLGRKHIKAQVEESLKRLQTSYIDLYQCHLPDYKTPLEETLRALDELVKSGKVHYIGLSNYKPAHLQRAVDLARHLDLAPIVCLQPHYNLTVRAPEWDLFDVCQQEGVGVIPWSPLAGGLLSGKYSKDATAAGTRAEWSDKFGFKGWGTDQPDSKWAIVDALREIAKETGHTVSQVALRWVMQNPVVTAPIVGVRNVAQLEDNIGATTFTLTPEQMKKLNDISEVDQPYPYKLGF
eukprot:TRINITY_DN6478_c0_g1_i1.p1 TRINITY_DN6478_c0_g1~~TRINITY_DN6478_c0_g1_i1.p1  ORF type:complete len:347 (-),score=96.50 TRINITY_DN6478_c0_g1_i1:53-1093(-)